MLLTRLKEILAYSTIHHEGCLIENVMTQAEENMKNELESKLLIDIAKEAGSKQKD